MALEKESKVSKIAEHTIWHFTGQPFLEWITKVWKPGISLLIGGPIGLFGHLTGVSIGWSVAISLESIGLIMLCWTLTGWRPKARSEVSKPHLLAQPPMTDLEFQTYSALKAEFDRLLWIQKVALKLIYSRPFNHQIEIHARLKNLGICEECLMRITLPLFGTKLISSTQGEMNPNPGYGKYVQDFLNGWNANNI